MLKNHYSRTNRNFKKPFTKGPSALVKRASIQILISEMQNKQRKLL